MPSSDPAPSVARFGAFELNLQTGELRKGGIRIRLQQQPFVVLSALLDQPGALVSREELQRRLWPDGRFVDYEDGLASAVKKIRRALQDSSATPRYIETLPKRGYRFISPVEFARVEPPERRVTAKGPLPHAPHRILRWGIAAAVVLGVLLWRAFDGRDAEANYTPSLPVALTMDSGVTADPAVSADGRWLVYTSDRDGGDDLDIWVQPLPPARGEPVRITDDPGHEIRPAISPDGEEIAWEAWTAAEKGIYRVRRTGGPQRRVGRGASPRYSPDGSWLAYREPNTLVVVPRGGGPARKLGGDSSHLGRVAWLPDSSGLITVSKPDAKGRAKLLITPLDGGAARELPLDPVYEAAGGRLVELGDLRLAAGSRHYIARTFRGGDVWRLRLASDLSRIDRAERLLELPVADVVHIDWVDEKLFLGVREPNLDIAALPLDVETGTGRGDVEPLTDDPVLSHGASLSADGRLMAYTSEAADGSIRPWFRDLRTGESYPIDRRLTPAGAVQISPDGSRIAFAAVPAGPRERFIGAGGSTQPSDLYVFDRLRGETRQVCSDCGEAEGWNSDATKLLTTDDPPGGGNTSIWAVDVESGARTLLAENLWGPMPSFVHGDSRVVFASGDRIWAAAYRDGRLAPEAEWVELAPPGHPKRFPVVSPGGRMLYYTSNADSHWCIWAQPIDPDTARPRGEPFTVYHSHRFREGLAPSWGTGLAIRPDGLVFSWQKDSGNIWMLEGVRLD